MAADEDQRALTDFDRGIEILDNAASVGPRRDMDDKLRHACWEYANAHEASTRCRACHSTVRTQEWRWINAAAMPEVKRAVLARDIFECPNCRNALHNNFKMTYHDPEKKLLLVYPGAGSRYESTLVRNEARFVDAGYTMRRVTSQAGIAEKVFLWESGLCDVAVELFKYITLGLLSSNAKDSRTRGWVDSVWDDDAHVVSIKRHSITLRAGGENMVFQEKANSVRELFAKGGPTPFINDFFCGDTRVCAVVRGLLTSRSFCVVEWRSMVGAWKMP